MWDNGTSFEQIIKRCVAREGGGAKEEVKADERGGLLLAVMYVFKRKKKPEGIASSRAEGEGNRNCRLARGSGGGCSRYSRISCSTDKEVDLQTLGKRSDPKVSAERTTIPI